MFGFLRSKSDSLVDYGFLKTDMHAHWLPGIDDGARDIEQSLVMIRGMKDLGYERLIATPHVMSEYYPNTPSIIMSKLAEVRAACDEANIDITLDAAAEYMVDDTFESHIDQYGLLPIADKQVLVEFGFYFAPMDARGILFRLQTGGYEPILAHPERYPYYHDDISVLKKFKDQGITLQVNILSLLGHYGKKAQTVAVQLIDAGMVNLLGTDAHRIEHIEKLGTLFKNRKIKRLIERSSFDNYILANSQR